MNREALRTFLALADKSSDLQGKVNALQKEAERHGSSAALAEGLAALSATAGSPVPATEWEAFLKEGEQPGQLADASLDAIVGGLSVKVTPQ